MQQRLGNRGLLGARRVEHGNRRVAEEGHCGSVIIGGDDNTITFDKVDTALTVAGLNNTITYTAGDPQIQDLGTGNTITKKP